MRNDISTVNTQPVTSPPSRSTATEASNVLRLLQVLPQSIADGQKMHAQVVTAKQAGEVFEVLLKMALPDGKQTTLPAQVNQVLSPGQQLTLTALSQSQFTLTPALDKLSPVLTRLDLAQTPSGSIIQAKVLNLEPQAQGNFRATLSITSGAMAGQTIAIESPKALALNSIITARIDGSFQLQFIPSSQNIDRLNIQQELLSQFNRQGSLAQALQQLQHTTSSNTNLSSEGHKAIQQLLNSLPDIGQKLTSNQLSELIKNSGTQLESRLLTNAAATEQDLKANLLRLIGQLTPTQAGASPLLSSTQAAMAGHALPQLLREIGGMNMSQAREQAQRFPLSAGVLHKLDNPNDLGALLRIAAAAISRLQTHQLSSLGQTYTTPEGTQLTTWQMEIPLRDQQAVVPLQLKFEQEQEAEQQDKEQKPPVWRLELSFELEPLGPLHVQVNLKNDELSSKLWAEAEHTAHFINQELHVLRDKLLAAGLNIKQLDCLQGTPPAAPKAAIEQRWIDDLV